MHAQYLLLIFVGCAAAQSNGDLRLVRNGLMSSSYTSGRLEIYYSGLWGTVCSDFWDSSNTAVACHHLGFAGSSLTSWTTGGFGLAPSTQPIWLVNVNCSGSELRLSSCPRKTYGVNGIKDCDHFEDVAIYCSTTDLVGIALGVSVIAFVLFVVVPVEICIIIGGVCSSRRSHTHTTVITKPPPPTTTVTAVTATAGYQPYPAQGYPPQHCSAAGTDTKTAPPPPYIAHPIRCLPTLPSNLRLNMIIPELSSHV